MMILEDGNCFLEDAGMACDRERSESLVDTAHLLVYFY